MYDCGCLCFCPSQTPPNRDRGAPGLSHLGTGDSTNPNPPRSTQHEIGVPPVPRIWGPGIARTPTRLAPLSTKSGAPGPSHLGTGDSTNPNPPRSTQHEIGCPIRTALFVVCMESWEKAKNNPSAPEASHLHGAREDT